MREVRDGLQRSKAIHLNNNNDCCKKTKTHTPRHISIILPHQVFNHIRMLYAQTKLCHPAVIDHVLPHADLGLPHTNLKQKSRHYLTVVIQDANSELEKVTPVRSYTSATCYIYCLEFCERLRIDGCFDLCRIRHTTEHDEFRHLPICRIKYYLN